MTNEELIAKIREEIEQRIHDISHPLKDGYEIQSIGKIEGLSELLDFLSTLEEQQKEVRNPIFDECVANVDPEVREEVSRNIDGIIDLEEAAGEYEKKHTYQRYDGGGFTPEYDVTLAEAFIAGAKWQAEHTPLPEDTVLFNKGVAEGRRLERDEFEKNRLAACSNQTEEEYDRETDFALGIIKKEHRQPTFSDAINYGMRLQKEQDERIYREFFNERNQGNASFRDLLAYKEGHSDGMEEQKEQMMKEAVEGFIFQSEDYYPKELVARYDGELKHGDKVRIIICKKED